ncbi:hypothetical protein ACFS07_36455 [Undibacterium arcticum]
MIGHVIANFPHVDTVSFVGGWDYAERMTDFEDGSYDPWVAEWSVVAWSRVAERSIDELVRMHSGSESLKEIVEGTHPNYSPTLATTRAKDEGEFAELAKIADAYDAAQKNPWRHPPRLPLLSPEPKENRCK